MNQHSFSSTFKDFHINTSTFKALILLNEIYALLTLFNARGSPGNIQTILLGLSWKLCRPCIHNTLKKAESNQLTLTESPHVWLGAESCVLQYFGGGPLDRELCAAWTCIIIIKHESGPTERHQCHIWHELMPFQHRWIHRWQRISTSWHWRARFQNQWTANKK